MNPVGGNIDYLRISVTDRCNFRCRHCMPPEGVEFKGHDRILGYEQIERFTRAAVAAGVSRVRLTGGEPLVRRQAADLVAMIASVPGVEDLALTTNGSLLTRYASELRAAGLQRINISIDSLNRDRFSHITGGAELGPVLDGLRAALEHGFDPVKVNVVLLEGVEDELESFIALVRGLPVHLRFIECMPVGRSVRDPWRFVPHGRILDRLREHGELTPSAAPRGAGPARYFRMAGTDGTIGFISAMSDHICDSCNRIRLTADGKLRNCLFSRAEMDVRRLVDGDPDVLRDAILGAIGGKKYDRRLVSPGGRTMSQIGG